MVNRIKVFALVVVLMLLVTGCFSTVRNPISDDQDDPIVEDGFSPNFLSDPSLTEWEWNTDGSWEVIASEPDIDYGAVKGKSITSGKHGLLIHKQFVTPQAYRISVKLKFTMDNSWSGIVFSFDNFDSYYVARLKSNSKTFHVIKMNNGTAQKILSNNQNGGELTSTIPLNEYIDFAVDVVLGEEVTVKLYVNGEQTEALTLVSELSPKAGTRIGFTVPTLTTYFKDLKVEEL